MRGSRVKYLGVMIFVAALSISFNLHINKKLLKTDIDSAANTQYRLF